MEIKLKRYEKEMEYSYAPGAFPTLELLGEQPDKVIKIIFNSKGETNKGVNKIKEICRGKNIEMETDDRLTEKLSGKENAYAIGVFKKYQMDIEKGKNHLVMVNPGDMGNLGTIIRTAVGMGINNLALIRPAADVWDPRTIRAAMGANFRIKFQYFETFDQYKSQHNNFLYPFMTNGKTELGQTTFKYPWALIFGSEADGLPEEYLKVGESVKIWQSGEVDSLNLSIAVGIGLYEAARQQLILRGKLM
jgi:RNA methyltransferase, TrmH family